MPDKSTIEKAMEDKREGKSASTQAGEFVHDEIKKIRKGEHGARSAKQAIAIGLSEARRAGVKLAPPKKGTVPEKTRINAERESEKALRHEPISRTRSRARVKALKREPASTVSKAALSRQAKSAAKKELQKAVPLLQKKQQRRKKRISLSLKINDQRSTVNG